MLIVDDEQHIADGLYSYFERADFADLEIIKVYSADDAIEWLNLLKIDIVLSDICMPGMDGMELIQEIMDRWPRCKVILLTGYDEFDYAHQAIRNTCVVDYLLKTEGMDRIRLAVEQTLERIASENDFHYQAEWFRDKLPRALPQLQKQLLLDIVRGSGFSGVRSIQEQLDAVHLSFSASLAVLPIVIRVEEWRNFETESDRSLIRYAVANIAEELLGDKAEIKAVDLDRHTVACFVQPNQSQKQISSEADRWRRTLRFVVGSLESVQQACTDCLQLSVSVIVSDQPVGWQELPQAVNRLSLAVLSSPGLGMEKLMQVDVSANPSGIRNQDTKYAVADLLLQHLKLRLIEGKLEWVDEFQKWTELSGEEGPRDAFLRMRLLGGIAECLLQTFHALGFDESHAEEIGLSRMLRFDIHTRWADVVAFYQSSLQWIVLRRSDHYKHDELQMLAKIHHYIKQNLKDDLSLTRIAQEVSLNPSYLSRWYKRVTGKGLSDYILERKVERSKELLVGTSYKMQDISAELGFSDQHYFFRFFKKAAGCTPQEYRDQSKS